MNLFPKRRRDAKARVQRSLKLGRSHGFENLESRRLLASFASIPAGEPTDTVHFRFDYSHDTGFFRDHPERRALLELAGRMITDRLSDTLDPIPASNASISWEAHYTDPGTGNNVKLPTGFSVAANEIVVFAGGRSLQALDFPGGGKVRAYADGVKTPFAYSCAATTQAQCNAFGTTLTTRGEGVTQGAGAVDFAPFVASLSFDNRSDTVLEWNFEDGPLLSTQFRFLTFAQHELAHVLGFGISNSFIAKAQAGVFNGPSADAAYVGTGHLPLNGGHLAQSVAEQQQSIMTSSIRSNILLGPVDFAVLDDIGWQVEGDPRRSISLSTSADALPESGGTFEITATLSSVSAVPIKVPVSIRGTGKLGTDFTLSNHHFEFGANQSSATILINVVDDEVYEAAESFTFAVLDSDSVRLGNTFNVQLTVFDDDGFDLATVRRSVPNTTAGTLTIPGDSQPHAIVFRAGAAQSLSVILASVEALDAGVLLYDDQQTVVGTYGATGLVAAALQTGESYALVFYPRRTSQTFSIIMPGGFNAAPPRHNVLFPADVNGSYGVTEVDALQVINQLNQGSGDPSVDAANVSGEGFYDVNGDGLITALDALQVINYLNKNGSAGEPVAATETDSNAEITPLLVASTRLSETRFGDSPADESKRDLYLDEKLVQAPVAGNEKDDARKVATRIGLIDLAIASDTLHEVPISLEPLHSDLSIHAGQEKHMTRLD